MTNSTTPSEDAKNKMREIAEALRAIGIRGVIATYSKDGLVLEYEVPDEPSSSYGRLYSVTCEMCLLFMALLTTRYPDHATTQYQGRFEWNADRGDLIHHHTVIHTGI